MVLGPEEVRLGGGPAWRGRGSGSTGPRWQVHRRQTARGVRRPRAARGTGCPQRGGRWPGRGTRARARAPRTEAGREPGSATWPASPHLDAGSVGGVYPGARPPGLPASRPPAPHPPQALVPRLPPLPRLGSARSPCPGGDGRAEEGRAPRPGGRSGPRGSAGGGGRGARARTAGARARRPRRALSRLGRPRCGRSAPTRRSPAQAPSDWPSMTSRPAPSQVSLDVAEVVGPSWGRCFQRDGR